MTSGPVYSPLCDTSFEAYSRYCAAVIASNVIVHAGPAGELGRGGQSCLAFFEDDGERPELVRLEVGDKGQLEGQLAEDVGRGSGSGASVMGTEVAGEGDGRGGCRGATFGYKFTLCGDESSVIDGSERRRPVKTGMPAVVSGGLPRGPNYLRNQAARMRKKIQQEERRMAAAEARGRWSVLAQGHGGGAMGGSTPGVVNRAVRTEKEQKLHELRVERQIIQEERRLKKLKSPEQMVVDAMQQVALAERCARMANNSRVAAWAAEIASASAESTARSSGSYGKVETVVTSVPEGESGKGSERSASSVKDEPVVVRMPYAKERASGAQRGPAGLPVRSDGIEYNWQTARAWLERYKYLEKYANEPGMNHAKLAGRCHVSLAEVKKYFRLKEEFKIKIKS